MFSLDGTNASSLISSTDALNRQPKNPPRAMLHLSRMARELPFQGFAKCLFHERKQQQICCTLQSTFQNLMQKRDAWILHHRPPTIKQETSRTPQMMVLYDLYCYHMRLNSTKGNFNCSTTEQ